MAEELSLSNLLVGEPAKAFQPGGSFAFTATMEVPTPSAGRYLWLADQRPTIFLDLSGHGARILDVQVRPPSREPNKYGNYVEDYPNLGDPQIQSVVTIYATVPGTVAPSDLQSPLLESILPGQVAKALALQLLEYFPKLYRGCLPPLAAGTEDVLIIRGEPVFMADGKDGVADYDAAAQSIIYTLPVVLAGHGAEVLGDGRRYMDRFTAYDLCVRWERQSTDRQRRVACEAVRDLFEEHLQYRPRAVYFAAH